MRSHASECVNLQKSLTPPVAFDTCPRSLSPTFLPSLFLLLPACHRAVYASESNYPIYMQNDASDAFVTAVPGESRDGRQGWAGEQSREVEMDGRSARWSESGGWWRGVDLISEEGGGMTNERDEEQRRERATGGGEDLYMNESDGWSAREELMENDRLKDK